MNFKALLVEKLVDGTMRTSVQDLPEDRLPAGDVTVAVEYTTLNYKDGLCMSSGGGMVRSYPHIPGIDFAGTVTASDDPRYTAGDKVVLTGWRVGESHWGGYASRARVKADWLVALPDGLTARQAMAVGTAGFTAMLAVMALEDHGLKRGMGEVLVTGAAGGVGSVAVALLAALGSDVAAVTGRPERFPVRRIFCVGRNYAEHAREMGHDPDAAPPFYFQKNPDNLNLTGKFPYPSLTSDLHYEVELAVIIGREIAVSALREWMAELGQRAKVKVAAIGKVKTIVQMVALTFLLYREPLAGFNIFLIGEWLLAAAALLTLWSGLAYLRAAWPALREDAGSPLK